MPPIPTPRGRLIPRRPLADLTWLRVGGAADWVFQPADVQDLSDFMAKLPPEVPVFPMGVGSNLIVRDGGIRAVVVRLGRGFYDVRIDGGHIVAGAGALDARVAMAAAAAGIDLTFLRTIPGAIGGAVRMNAGCYGRYIADVFAGATAVRRTGEVVTLTPDDMTFAYRATDLPEDLIITEVRLTARQRTHQRPLSAKWQTSWRSAMPHSPPKNAPQAAPFATLLDTAPPVALMMCRI